MKKKMSQWPSDIIWRIFFLRSVFIVVSIILDIGCVVCVIEERPLYLNIASTGGNNEATLHPGAAFVNQSYTKELYYRIKADKPILKRDVQSKRKIIPTVTILNNNASIIDDCSNNKSSNHKLKHRLKHSNMTGHNVITDNKQSAHNNSINSYSEYPISATIESYHHFPHYFDSSSNKTSVGVSNETSSKTILYIGGLFDLTGSRSESLGRSELTAARLAIDHVNTENILPGYKLQLLHNNTGCDPGVAMDALYDLIYRRQRILMVMGSACSEVTKTLAEIVPYWNLILVSFASTSPALSEREKYETFFRLAPADSSQNIPRAHFITHFGWDTVATLYEMDEDYSLAINDLGRAFEQNNITIKISQSFRRYDDVVDNLGEIQKQDARIIFGSFSEKAARHVLCAAYTLNMYGPRYVWIFMGDYVERWWERGVDKGGGVNREGDTPCDPAQLGEAAEGYFTIDSLSSLSDDDLSTANISLRQFMSDYKAYHGPEPMSPYATSTYDTVWTIALTLRQTHEHTNDSAELGAFSYTNGTNLRDRIFGHMQDLGFYGISGPISFEGPDRKGISVISQNQHGRMSRIALYEPDKKKLNFFCRTCRAIAWTGGRAPRDKKVLVPRQKTILPAAFVCVSSVSCGGLVLAAGFLAYNLYHRRLRYIKLSSPKLNNVAVVGCMLVYSGIIVLGYDDLTFGEQTYPYICTIKRFIYFVLSAVIYAFWSFGIMGCNSIRVFLFAAGFSLAFGAMFTKTYRVHQIFTRANSGLIRSKLLRDKQLLFIIGALLVVDSAILLLWVFIDPMQKHVTNLHEEASENDEDLFFISQLTTCHSEHLEKWTGAMYAYKGLLLVFGVYMAWETRNVKIPALNDSQYIGMNVYNVVMMSLIVVTLSNVLQHQPTLAYVMESSFMLLSTTTTLCLLFVPKLAWMLFLGVLFESKLFAYASTLAIYSIVTSAGEPVITASGITVDNANCRRFAVDERRDLFYRAEVQNRVYKREIVELDQEIMRLEGLLELPVQPYPRLTAELLYLLPESRVDPTPTLKRRKIPVESCISISDAGDVCLGLSDEKSDDETEAITKSQSVLNFPQASPRPFQSRASRLSIRIATSFAVSKLCKLRSRSRYSVGSLNPDRCDLRSCSSSQDIPPLTDYAMRGRLSHPLLRQEAVEDRRAPLFTLKQSSEKSDTVTHETHLSDNDNDFDVAQCSEPVTFGLHENKDYLRVPSTCHWFGCETANKPCHGQSVKRKRKYSNTLEVPVSLEECKISSVDICDLEHPSPRVRRARSIIEHERRTRIRKLQAALMKIQKELQDLDELEYEVSIV